METDSNHTENLNAVYCFHNRFYLYSKKPERHFYIEIENMLMVESNNHLMQFFFKHNSNILTHEHWGRLKNIWKMMPPDIFIYDNGSHSINWQQFEAYYTGEQKVVFKNSLL